MPSPRQRLWWLSAIGAAAVVAVLVWQQTSPTEGEATDPSHRVLAPIAGWFNSRPATTVVEASERAASNVGDVRPFNPLDSTALPVFQADEKRRLRIDIQTRDGVEKLVALYGQDHGLDKLEALSLDLPPEARHDLRDLYQRYMQYSQAMATAIPPNQSTLADALKQFNTLHDLRVQYFGEDNAKAMFGDQEATTAQLLKDMQEQAKATPNATMEDLARQAQDKYQQEHPDGR